MTVLSYDGFRSFLRRPKNYKPFAAFPRQHFSPLASHNFGRK